jgi:KEOPS complex subunit Cgi121
MELVEGTATVEDVDASVERLAEIERETGAAVQAFDARYIVGRDHLERAVELARREREQGNAIAREERVEILLYAAGRRQINRALEMGISTGDCPVVAVVVGGDKADAAERVAEWLEPAETLGAYDRDRVCEFFDVTGTELDATDDSLSDIVRERVALLVVER